MRAYIETRDVLRAHVATHLLPRVAPRHAPPVRKRRTDLSGVIVIDKPRGPTSHDVVAKLRRLLGTREVGHAGTLDPMATGVLVVAFGEATKLVPYLTAADKSYDATIALGAETDSLDAEGEVIARDEVNARTRDAIAARLRGDLDGSAAIAHAIAAEEARTSQVPPVYSAIHHDGERAHVRARRGEVLEMEPREVVVHAIRWRDGGLDPSPWIALSLDVGKGYYVRSMARDFARALETRGHLTALRRTRSGPFTLADAQPLDTDPEALRAHTIALADAAARSLPTAQLTDVGVRDARFGRPVARSEISACTSGPHAWLDAAGTLVAIGETRDDTHAHVLRGFALPPTASSRSPL